MEKVDLRRLSKSAQSALRSQVIRARQAGRTYREISEQLGVHKGTACDWWKSYEAKGEAALTEDNRGRPRGTGQLNPEQCAHLQRLITDKFPNQMKLSFALWTRLAVRDLIEQEYQLRLPIRTVGHYLKQWGFTPQRPAKRAYEQCPKAVQQWLDHDYLAIAHRARQEQAEIHWGDESGIRSDHQAGRSYAPKGKTPTTSVPAKRVRVQMISTVTNQGKLRFMLYEETMTGQLLIKFLKRLITDTDRKVFLILDNLRVHHSRIVKAWLTDHQTEIEVFYLPAYSPERNPDEYLNGDLKRSVHSQTPARSADEMKKKMTSRLRSIQKRPDHVKSYFRHECVQYAA